MVNLEPAILGTGVFYMTTCKDAEGDLLNGSSTKRSPCRWMLQNSRMDLAYIHKSAKPFSRIYQLGYAAD